MHPALLHWRSEKESAALYAGLAALERNSRRRAVFRRLAELEDRHAEVWQAVLRDAGQAPAAFRPSRRTRFLLALARRLGTAAVLPRVARLEARDVRRYLAADASGTVVDEERSTAAMLAAFSQAETAEFVKRLLLRFRRTVILLVGATLFGVSLALARNVQLEGLFFGLLTGVAVGPVVHYLLGKVLIPLPLGRVWCGWACWTGAIVDQLPFRRPAGWLAIPYRRGRLLHFVLSLALVSTLVLALGYRGGAVGQQASLWFLVGNAVYAVLAIGLALRLRDNRAFCKYACPVSVILRITARPALVKIAGDAEACRSCSSRACTTLCPMDVDIPAYVSDGTRILSTECILCGHCVAVCPPNTLGFSVSLDVGGLEYLQSREANPSQAAGVGPQRARS
jgi:ferredoxin-type protein NapH